MDDLKAAGSLKHGVVRPNSCLNSCINDTSNGRIVQELLGEEYGWRLEMRWKEDLEDCERNMNKIRKIENELQAKKPQKKKLPHIRLPKSRRASGEAGLH